MALVDFLFGRALTSAEDQRQRVGPAQGIPIFGLDALSSAAYGPEAALVILLPLGLAGLAYIVPLTGAIILLLAIVYFSYRQTIAAYPAGGGSYTVSKENLGTRAGLLAAAALMIDYLLNVTIGISAGVGALISAVPSLEPHTLSLCFLILVLITMLNMRGLREPGVLFMAPAVIYSVCLLGVIGWGVAATLLSGGHPHPAVHPLHLPPPQQAVSTWLLVSAFANGCTALTGVEAVSNGVQTFREPAVPAARKALTTIIGILILLLAGIAFLVHSYGIGASAPGQPGYQSVLSQLIAAIAGKGAFYYITLASVLVVLCLSANTSFAGFPQLCRSVAVDGYLPHSFAIRGRRLVYSEGIIVLGTLAAILLGIFGGITDRLIPLFAVGAFLAFTLSQAGMVAHWKRVGGRGAKGSMLVNAIGAVATGATTLVVLVAKFVDGAWIVALLLFSLVVLMASVRRHYDWVALETAPGRGVFDARIKPPLVVVPIETWNSVAKKALRFALTLSEEVRILHVEYEGAEPLDHQWTAGAIEEFVRASGRPAPKLVVLRSPYRYVIHPILDHVLALEREHPGRTVAVVIATLVERHWYHYFLHNQRGELLTHLLLIKGDRRIVIVRVPWYLGR